MTLNRTIITTRDRISTSQTMSQLSYARYGKDNVRLYKVKRNSDGTQDVVEMTIRVLLEGDIETS